MAGRRLKAKTIKGYLAGLRSLRLECTLGEAQLKVYSHPILQRIIKGFRRIYGEGDTRERQPITRDILLKLISRFDQTAFEGANLHAAFCLAFAGFLRMGEFTYDKVESDFSSWNLTRGSVSFSEDRLFLVIPSCKTDPFRRGIILTISAANDDACAVASLNSLFTRFPKANNQPLFANQVGTFSRNYVTKKLQEEVRVLGYEWNYTSHSFRRGAATSARLAGLSEDEVQLLGRWKSNCYRLYIETHPDWIHNASRRHQLSSNTRLPRSFPQNSLPSSPSASNSAAKSTNYRPHFHPYPYPIPNPTTKSTCVDILSTGIGVWE